MKKVLKKVDWFQVGVIGLGLAASLAKSIYEAKKLDADIEKKYEEHIEKLIDKKLSKSK